MPRFLHLKSLKLRNFKGVAELDLAFDETLTLLVGVNGVGKTSIIQALVAAVTHAYHITPPHDYRPFEFPASVTHDGTSSMEIVLEVGVPDQSPAELCLAPQGNRLTLVGARSRGLPLFPKNVQPQLPLVVYYEQNRGVNPDFGGRNVQVSSVNNRVSSLHTTISSPSEFKAWFFEKEADEGRETRERKDLSHEDPELKTIRGVLARLDEFTAIRSRKPADRSERILFLEKNGADIPFDSLSGGEQAFFLLAADLARRLMLESPNAPAAEAPGIVCIDEIELHLHPAWQRRILKTLMKTFPGCQFVVSTHSPQVIAGVEARYVRLLTPGRSGVRKVSQPIASKGHDSNYVLKGILDTPERDDEVSELLAEFDRFGRRPRIRRSATCAGRP